MNIKYSKIAETIICKSVIETDKVSNKTKFLFCFVSDALFMAGMRTLLVGMAVIKIPNAKKGDIISIKPNDIKDNYLIVN